MTLAELSYDVRNTGYIPNSHYDDTTGIITVSYDSRRDRKLYPLALCPRIARAFEYAGIEPERGAEVKDHKGRMVYCAGWFAGTEWIFFD